MPDLLERLTEALADRYAIEREVGRGGMDFGIARAIEAAKADRVTSTGKYSRFLGRGREEKRGSANRNQPRRRLQAG